MSSHPFDLCTAVRDEPTPSDQSQSQFQSSSAVVTPHGRLPVDDDVIEGSPLHAEQVCVQGRVPALLLQRSDVISDEPLQVGVCVLTPDEEHSSVCECVTCPHRPRCARTPNDATTCARAAQHSRNAAQYSRHLDKHRSV